MSVRNEVLRLFEQNRGQTLSGQSVAERLCVTRAAVWKAVEALREEGYPITAVTKKGYRLDESADVLSEEGIRAHLGARWDDIPVLVYDCVDSTNSCAKIKAAQGARHGTIVASDAQTAGRGRMGRPFFSPPGTGLYLSVILRPQMDLSASLMITVAAAVAVCEAVESLTDARPLIKWVNDIYIGGKKAGGILCEAVSDFESGMVESVVVGIGLNCTTAPEAFPPELRGRAASLLDGIESPGALSRCRLAARAVGRLLDWQDRLADNGLMRAYRERSLLLGKEIRYEKGGRVLRGVVRDINEAGNLVVNGEEGPRTVLSAGDPLRVSVDEIARGALSESD